MKFAILWLVLFSALYPFPLRAQTNATKPALHSDRYLLIVETSRAMDKRSDGTLKVAQGLLVSGMNGQMQRGDSLGVWTFNQDLYTGRLPLQQWSPETEKDVAKRTLNFLKGQKYEKQANLSKILPLLDRVVKGSQVITVILISAGEDYIHGTPFDDDINRSYKSWRQQQKDARMPFVTVLRGKSGKLTDYAVTAAPWPVEIPPLQPEKQVAEAAPPKPEPPQKAPPPAVPPLILSGKKTSPTSPADPAAERPQPPSVDPTNETSKVPDAAPPPATSEKPAATTLLVANAIVEGQSPTAAATKIEAGPPVPGQLLIEATPRQTNQAGSTTINKLSPPSENAPAGPGSGVGTAPTNSGILSATTPAESKPALSPPTVVRAREPAPSPQTAVVAPADSLLKQLSFWLALGVVAAISLGIIVLLLRRARASPPASLITRSLDPNEK